MLVYRTQERKGYGKQDYYYKEYRREGDEIVKYHCRRFKTFDGKENYWVENEKIEDSWNINDENMPEWLHKYL